MVRKCHFDVTACAEARRLAQRAERSLRDLSSLWGQPARFARRLDKIVIIGIRAHQQNIGICVLVQYVFVGLVIFVITIAIFIFQVLFRITLRIKTSSSDEKCSKVDPKMR